MDYGGRTCLSQRVDRNLTTCSTSALMTYLLIHPMSRNRRIRLNIFTSPRRLCFCLGLFVCFMIHETFLHFCKMHIFLLCEYAIYSSLNGTRCNVASLSAHVLSSCFGRCRNFLSAGSCTLWHESTNYAYCRCRRLRPSRPPRPLCEPSSVRGLIYEKFDSYKS